MVRSRHYGLRNIGKVNYSESTAQNSIKQKSTKKTTKKRTKKNVSKKPIPLKNKRAIKKTCPQRKGIEDKMVQLFKRLNKQSLDSDLIAIGYLFNCMFTNNPESISYDLEKIRRYINSKKTKEQKGQLIWENLKALYFSAANL